MTRLIVCSATLRRPDPDAFNITRQTGGDTGAPFAPSWAILRPALHARQAAAAARTRGADLEAAEIERVAWLVYHAAFLDEMRRSYATHRRAWTALLARERVCLVCFCSVDEALAGHCHRTILRREILSKLGALDGGELLDVPAVDPQMRLL